MILTLYVGLALQAAKARVDAKARLTLGMLVRSWIYLLVRSGLLLQRPMQEGHYGSRFSS